MTIKTGTFRNTFCASVLVSLAYAFSNGTQKGNAYIRQLTMQFLSEIQNEQSSQGSFPTQRSHFRLFGRSQLHAELKSFMTDITPKRKCTAGKAQCQEELRLLGLH